MTDYTELVKALRHCTVEVGGFTDCRGCPYEGHSFDCETKLHTDAAAAIEALQAKLPKRGKWLNETDSHHWYGKCSVCGEEFVVDAYYAGGMNYCPNCGTKMEVQDGQK